jgi:aspartate racemase
MGKDVQLIFPYIENSIKQLEKAGAEFIVLPCNTLHLLKDRIRKTTNLPFLDMVEEVSKKIKEEYKKIGILCTTKTKKERLYDNLLQDVEVIYPTEDQQKKVSDIILKIIRKTATKEDKNFLFSLVDEMISSGAEKVLLACTDLANILGKDERFIDSVDVLIERNDILRTLKGAVS